MAISGTKDTTCYVCGPDNPLGLRVPFERDGEAGSTAVYVARKEHGGWNGILHGGVTFSIGTRLHIRTWVVRQRRRLYDARAEVRIGDAAGEVAAESEAVLCRVPPAEERRDLATMVEVGQRLNRKSN